MPFKNPYTEVLRAEQARFKLKPQHFKPVCFANLPEIHVKSPTNLNRTWGPWSFEVTENDSTIYYELYHEAMDYGIELNDINSIADIYRWVVHMSAKNTYHYGEGFLYFLCGAFQDIWEQSGINLRYDNTEFKGIQVAAKYNKLIQVKRYVSARTRHKILERDGFRCLDCGASPLNGALLEVDHTIPISKGGTNDPSNLRTLCSDCNRGKSDRIVQYD
jgi:hypothetical protein